MSGPVIASGVEAEKVDFLWNGRIPFGMISIIAGRPDQGKGLLAAHIAAEASSGRATEGKTEGRTGPVNVLYSAAEDSHGLMTRPRLEAADADLERILLWRFLLPDNFNEFADIVIKQEIGLVVMDPFASHLGGGISRHSDNVRQVLGPVTELIESTGTAVLIIEHALKRGPASGHPLQFIGGGGSGLPAFARAAYVYGTDPDDEDRRILAKAKFNIGPPPKALAFEVEVEDLDIVGEVPMLVEAEELMAFDPMRLFQTKTQPGKVGRPPDKRAAAAEWLTLYLADAKVPVLSSKIQEDSKQHGMSVKTLRRAAEDMGVVKAPPGGGRNCTWELPADVREAMGLDAEETIDDAIEGPMLENGEFYADPRAAVLNDDDLEMDAPMTEVDMDDELAKLLGGDSA